MSYARNHCDLRLPTAYISNEICENLTDYYASQVGAGGKEVTDRSSNKALRASFWFQLLTLGLNVKITLYPVN